MLEKLKKRSVGIVVFVVNLMLMAGGYAAIKNYEQSKKQKTEGEDLGDFSPVEAVPEEGLGVSDPPKEATDQIIESQPAVADPAPSAPKPIPDALAPEPASSKNSPDSSKKKSSSDSKSSKSKSSSKTKTS